jgi:hypothetical protein
MRSAISNSNVSYEQQRRDIFLIFHTLTLEESFFSSGENFVALVAGEIN